jgi:hypothetical protein
MSITLCPYSLSSVIYFGNYKPTNKIYNNNLILADENEKDKIMSQMLGNVFSISENKHTSTEFIRKKEVRIMTLRNVISIYPDSLYLHHDIKHESLINDAYFKDKTTKFEIHKPSNKILEKFHPKTLIYGIEYKSKDVTVPNFKYTAIIGRKASKEEQNFDFVKNSYDVYFEKMIDKIREKGGIIIPCFLISWFVMYPDSKIVELLV